MMLKEVLERATDLLQEVKNTPVSGTYLTVAEDTPQGQQDFEWYTAWWGDVSWTSQRVNSDQWRFVVTMPGYLQSFQALTGNPYTVRVVMYQYMDLILQKFIERPRLENTSGQPLSGVTFEGTGISAGQYRAARFPDDQSQIVRNRYAFTLTVTLVRAKVC